MKSHLKYFLMIFTIMIVLTACVSQPKASITEPPSTATQTEVFEEQTASETATQTPAAIETMTPEPAADMDALIREKLAGHHDIERVYRAVKTREQWIATLDRMIGYGAQITEEEKQLIADYLVNRTP